MPYKEYAPTLHKKLEQCFLSQAAVKWRSHGKQLPKTIVMDEKTQGQLAGILVGKAVLNPKAFTVWAAVFTVLTTAAVKSVTKSPEAYGKVIDSKYRPTFEELQSANWSNASSAFSIATRLKTLIEESGVTVTSQEAMSIIREVSGNAEELRNSVTKVNRSLIEFSNVIDE